jgi:hypothetical protein
MKSRTPLPLRQPIPTNDNDNDNEIDEVNMVDYPSRKDIEHGEHIHYVSLWEYMMLEIDPSYATAPLAAFCFMTGFM